MRTWTISNLEFRTNDSVIVIAHWRYGSQYGSQSIADAALVAGVADEEAIVAAVKVSLGDKVATIEAAAVNSEADQTMPSIRSTSLARVADALATAIDDKADRAALLGRSTEQIDALLTARRALDAARTARDAAKVARDSSVAVREATIADLAAKTATRDAAVTARDAGIAAGTTGAPMQALRDAVTAANTARSDAIIRRDAATADATAKNSALDAATTALATARANLQTVRG